MFHRRVFSPAPIGYRRINDYTCVLWSSVPHDWDAPGLWAMRCLNEIGYQQGLVVDVHERWFAHDSWREVLV